MGLAMTVQGVLQRPRVRSGTQRSDDPGRAEQTRDYLRRAAETTDSIGKAWVLEKVVLANLPVAERLAKRYSGRGISSEDLVQVARLGLVQAAQRFDPDAGVDFLSFAVPTILGELKRHFRDRGWSVRPPRRIQELSPRIAAATSRLSQTMARTPSRAELADDLGVNETDIVETQAAAGCFAATSLDRPLVSGSNASVDLVDTVGGVDRSLEWVELATTLAPIFRRLSDRDRLVLRLRLVDDMTQRDIGCIIGVTQMQVSRILTRIMSSARDELAG
jgi:RNA polymerase sigma-B factor